MGVHKVKTRKQQAFQRPCIVGGFSCNLITGNCHMEAFGGVGRIASLPPAMLRTSSLNLQ